MRPRFLTIEEVIVIHQLMIASSGGADGVRDIGMLESAIQRAVNRWDYEGGSVPRLAADYAYGIARNHPFVDGNKRTAFIAAYTFLGLNGYTFASSASNV